MSLEKLLEHGALNDALRVYSFGGDRLQLGVFPENQRVLSDPTGIVRALIERGAPGRSLAEVHGELVALGYTASVVEETFLRLQELGLLEHGPRIKDRYDRQRRFFEIFKDRCLPGEYHQERLRQAGVLVLGLNSAGSKLAQQLAGMGLRVVRAVDARPVDQECVAHQHLFTAAMIGLPRHAGWTARAAGVNPDCDARAVASLAEAVDAGARFDLCVLADALQFPIDQARTVAERLGAPLLAFGLAGGRGLIEPIYRPGHTPCPLCLATPLAARPGGDVADPAQRALLLSMLGNLAALQALKFLSGFSRPNNLHDRLWLDPDAEGPEVEELQPAETCAACREAAASAAPSLAADASEPAEQLLAGRVQPESRVELHDLVENRDKDQVIVGREATGSFLALGEMEWRYLRLLRQGLTPREAAAVFERFFHVAGLKVASFFESLAGAGFVKKVDARPLEVQPDGRRLLLTRIQPRHVAFLFARPALAFYGLFIGLAAALALLDPRYLPHYRDVYFHSSVSVSLITNALVGWITIAPHELFHLFAAKSLGCDSSMSIGHRLMFVVVQTDVSNIWKVPRSRRHIVYLAGMLSDALIVALCIHVLHAMDAGWIARGALLYPFLKSVIYIQTFKLVWNCLFYMRTDVYFFIANLLQCRNLHEDTRAFIRAELARELPWVTPAKLDMIPPRELRFVKLYAAFFLAGTIITLAAFCVVLLPIGMMFRNAIFAGVAGGLGGGPLLAGGLSGRAMTFLDSAVAGSLVMLHVCLLAYSVLRSRRRQRAARRAQTQAPSASAAA